VSILSIDSMYDVGAIHMPVYIYIQT